MGVTTGEHYIPFVQHVPTLESGHTATRWRLMKPRPKSKALLWPAIMLVMLGLVSVTLARLAQPPFDPAVAAMLKHTKTFGVMCPSAEMTNEEHQQWVSYVAAKGYSAYPAAGAGCVDP